MPPSKDSTKKQAPATRERTVATFESTAFLKGLFDEFHAQTHKYNDLTGELLHLEARIELAEKTLCVTREHFRMAIARTQDAMPNDWSVALNSVRYVGVRLADACAKALQQHNKMTPEQLLKDLNDGMFRFRTNSPLREIHAALMRHPHVKKNGGAYVWTAPAEKQLPMRLRVVEGEIIRKEAKPN